MSQPYNVDPNHAEHQENHSYAEYPGKCEWCSDEKVIADRKDFHNFLDKMIVTHKSIRNGSKDRLFDADHRNKMINAFGYTEAMGITIEELTKDK